MEDPTDNITDLGVRELIARLASRAPIPGGGSAAALSGALGASLVAMVAELTIGRADAAPHDAQLRDLRDRALARQQELLDLAEEDSRAYGAVVAARRLPKGTEDERHARSEAVHRSMVAAAEVPLRTAHRAAEVLELARAIAPISNPNAVSDAGVAGALGAAAVRGAILNVRINLPYLPHAEPMRERAPAELRQLAASAAQAEAEIVDTVDARIEPS